MTSLWHWLPRELQVECLLHHEYKELVLLADIFGVNNYYDLWQRHAYALGVPKIDFDSTTAPYHERYAQLTRAFERQWNGANWTRGMAVDRMLKMNPPIYWFRSTLPPIRYDELLCAAIHYNNYQYVDYFLEFMNHRFNSETIVQLAGKGEFVRALACMRRYSEDKNDLVNGCLHSEVLMEYLATFLTKRAIRQAFMKACLGLFLSTAKLLAQRALVPDSARNKLRKDIKGDGRIYYPRDLALGIPNFYIVFRGYKCTREEMVMYLS